MYIIKRPRQFIIREVGDGPQCFAGSRRDGDSLLCFDGERRAHGIAMTVPMEFFFSTFNFFFLLLPPPTSAVAPLIHPNLHFGLLTIGCQPEDVLKVETVG